MFGWLHRCRTDKKGVTLLELIIILAILGVLASVVVPQTARNIQTARSKLETYFYYLDNAIAGFSLEKPGDFAPCPAQAKGLVTETSKDSAH